MPNINYKNTPGAGTLAVGGTPTGTDISENWYYPTTVGDKSLEVINGHLDGANLDSSLKFDNRHFQRGTVSQGKMVGCTANIDYFGEMFSGATTYNAAGTYKEMSDDVLAREAVAVPGLGIRFYVPFGSAKCVLQWNFNHQNDGPYTYGGDERGYTKNFPCFFLFIDGVMDPVNARRYVPGIIALDATGATGGNGVNFSCGRAWSGHKLVTLTKGWHSAEVRIMLPAWDNGIDVLVKINQCRVRTRGMRYILFR